MSSPPAAVEKPAPPPPPKRPPIRLTYRGSLTRSDGTVTALIEDSRSSRSIFYPAGTNLFGLRLERIAPGEIALTGDSDRLTVLKRGETAAIEEPDHGH